MKNILKKIIAVSNIEEEDIDLFIYCLCCMNITC